MEKVLIVYPYSNIATNPTMCALIDVLLQSGIQVDLIADDAYGDEFPELSVGRQAIRQLPVDDRIWWSSNPLGLAKRVWRMSQQPAAIDPAWFRRFAAKHYSCILGADPVGIATAASLNSIAQVPLVCLSFEILLTDEANGTEERRLKEVERAALQDCQLVLVQDSARANLLARDNGLRDDVFCHVPVAPIGPLPKRTNELRTRLEIPPNQKIVLFQGSIAGWSGRDEWESMLSTWTDDIALVIHSRRTLGARERKLLDRLSREYALYVSDQPVAAEQLGSLTASADVGLVSYIPNAENWLTLGNLETIGFASGKFSTFLMSGIPVLVNQRTTLGSLVDEHNLGASYESPETSLASLQRIFAAHDEMSASAREFYESHLDPTAPIQHFMSRLTNL